LFDVFQQQDKELCRLLCAENGLRQSLSFARPERFPELLLYKNQFRTVQLKLHFCPEMVSRRKVVTPKKSKNVPVASRPKTLRSKSKAKVQSLKSAAAKSASIPVIAAAAPLPSTPTKSPASTSPSRKSTNRSPAVKKSISKTSLPKKVLFAPETKFNEVPKETHPSTSASNPIRVGAEALVAVGAALTAWFYPLFTTNLATNGR
jgi:hypothetical protein